MSSLPTPMCGIRDRRARADRARRARTPSVRRARRRLQPLRRRRIRKPSRTTPARCIRRCTRRTPGSARSAAWTWCRYAKGEAKSGAVRVDPARLQQIGVRFATVERAPLVRTIRAHRHGRPGTRRSSSTSSLQVGGCVRELRADALGARVATGEPLFTVYSPQLYAAQAEYLDALARRPAPRAARRARDALGAPRARACASGIVADRDVAALARRGEPFEALPVRAPRERLRDREERWSTGAAFEPGVRLFRIAPLDRVWVDARGLRVGRSPLVASDRPRASARRACPGARSRRASRYVLPGARRARRARRACGSSSRNADLALRPEMFVDVELRADLGDARCSCPRPP